MKQFLRAVAEVRTVYGLPAWVFAAAAAAFTPACAMSTTVGILVRCDTFGPCCLVLSDIGPDGGQLDPGPRVGRARRTEQVDAVLPTVSLCPLLRWVYRLANYLIHQRTIDQPLTRFSDSPGEGTAASAGFLVSAAALLVSRIQAHRRESATGVG